jgi:hypothetical protein
MIYIGNTFSLDMLSDFNCRIKVREIENLELPKGTVYKSIIGHANTAKILGYKFNREEVKLKRGDVFLVAQLEGGQLPEGATTLPEGFSFKYLKVEIINIDDTELMRMLNSYKECEYLDGMEMEYAYPIGFLNGKRELATHVLEVVN